MNKDAMRLLMAIGEVEERFAEETAQCSTVRRGRVIAAVVACAAVIALSVSAVFAFRTLPLSGTSDDMPFTPSETTPKTTTAPTKAADDTPSSKVIFLSPLESYSRGPEIGEAFVECPIALMEQADRTDARELVQIVLYDENGPILHSEGVYEELDRLKSLGYELYVYEEEGTDYWGTPRHVTHVCSYVTLKQLKLFPAGDRFGYSISTYHYSVPIESYKRY